MKMTFKELNIILKRHNLALGHRRWGEGFIITDWSYHYHHTSYNKSELKRFAM